MKNCFWLIGLLMFVACSTQKTTIKTPKKNADASTEVYSYEDYEVDDELEERILDPLEIIAPRDFVLPRYNPSATRLFDLIHTDLDLRFDWQNEEVIGRAQLTLKPYFYEQQFLTLDAKGFQIIGVSDTLFSPFSYTYDGTQIKIDLKKPISRLDHVYIIIDYIAKPSESSEGGSAAITSDQGLFFINAQGQDPNKPQQIWTQGETENNSRWFPTIDKPNENMTQRISLTVADTMVTLSNGVLVSSKKHTDGSRTDVWEQKDPHAPYLAMIAVGNFAVVKENWNGIELSYFVEKKFEPFAKEIFAHTPEMLQFFSDRLNYTYPWEKFGQIVVRDYVSGAMENTTAVVFGEFVQKTDRDLIDNNNDYIVAHEMFHHWFGNLVTCESWANLTLQEGFANYSEYLWEEHKRGRDAADQHRKNELAGYLSSTAQTGRHPLIHFGYDDKEDMFDGHSYNKGGLVLHMLRDQLGDEAFFAGLNKYLVDNAYTSAEVDELRMAFEEVTGLDLHWFFDQWYLSSGHPELEIEWEYEAEEGTIYYTIHQTQDIESNLPIYQLPVSLSIYDAAGKETVHELYINKREQLVEIRFPTKPSLIVFDRKDVLLFQKKERKSTTEFVHQYTWAKAFAHRHEAISQLKNKPELQSILNTALKDPHHAIRSIAVSGITETTDPALLAQIIKLSSNDPHSQVRAAAVKALSRLNYDGLNASLEKIFDNERSYTVINAALETLAKIDKPKAILKAQALKNEFSNTLVSAIAPLLASTGDMTHSDYFESRLNNVSLFSVFNFYDAYFELLNAQPSDEIVNKAENLQSIATNESNHFFYRYAATSLINDLKELLRATDPTAAPILQAMITTIKDTESNQMLLQRYNSF